jgi:hypothetical protein
MILRYQIRCYFSALTVVALLLAGLSCCGSSAEAQTAGGASVAESLPFRPGESQVYELRWGVIPAGFAELAVLPAADLDGIPVWHFRLLVRTNDFVDFFYKVRDKIEAFADLSLGESLLYRKSQREGHHLREEEVRFDPDQKHATYSNHGEVAPPISLMAGTIDPLTAVFFIRGQPLREGLEIRRPITDGKKNVTGVARVLGRERLEVDGVYYDTFRVEPDLRDVGGVFEKSAKSRITLWFSVDGHHRLVKIEGKVLVGSFTGTLSNLPGGVRPSMD